MAGGGEEGEVCEEEEVGVGDRERVVGRKEAYVEGVRVPLMAVGGNLADGRGRDFLLCGGEGDEWGKFGTGGRVEG